MNLTSILNTRTAPHVYTTFMYTRLFVNSWRSYIGELRRTASGLGELLKSSIILTKIVRISLLNVFGAKVRSNLTCYTTLPAKK